MIFKMYQVLYNMIADQILMASFYIVAVKVVQTK